MVNSFIRMKIMLLAACLILLAACDTDESENFIEKMMLNDRQAAIVKPILDEYLNQQAEIFKEVKEKLSGNPEGFGKPESYTRSNNPPALPDDLNQKFEDNDKQAMEKMTAYVNEEQLRLFKKFAVEYRRAKFKELMGISSPGKGGRRGTGRGRPGGSGGF